jgi:hypothetical protein
MNLLLRAVRIGAAGLGAAAVATALSESTGSTANFVSFFTIESNLLAIVVLAAGGLADPRSPRWAWFRGLVTLAMVITGIVYAALLRDVDVQLQSPWINTVLHQALPLILLADWVFFPPWPRTSARHALAWLLFPLAYFAYSLLRGPIADWYPYPFLDPRPHGYDHVALYAVVLALGMAALALLLHRIAHLRTPAA